MKKYLLLILLVAIGFGQDSQDTDLLILKKGARYEGEFLGVKSGKVHFKPKNVMNVKPRVRFCREVAISTTCKG